MKLQAPAAAHPAPTADPFSDLFPATGGPDPFADSGPSAFTATSLPPPVSRFFFSRHCCLSVRFPLLIRLLCVLSQAAAPAPVAHSPEPADVAIKVKPVLVVSPPPAEHAEHLPEPLSVVVTPANAHGSENGAGSKRPSLMSPDSGEHTARTLTLNHNTIALSACVCPSVCCVCLQCLRLR